MKRQVRRWEIGLVVGLSTLSLVACKGGKEPALPTGTNVEKPTHGGPGAVTTPSGQQFGVTDAPSSGEAEANRPKMNAAAAQAYQAGLAAFQNGDLQGARTQFSQAAQADANAYQANYSLGVVRERIGDTNGALTSYRKAITIVPDYEPAIVGYALLLARSGRASEAEEYLNERQAKMAKSAAVTAALAEVKSIQGDSGAAQRLAQEALKKNPDYRPAMVTMARDHYRNRRLDLALYTLKGILDGYGDENPPRDKNNAEAHLLRGLIYKEQSQRVPAIDELRKALELRPDLVEARVHLAAFLLEAGNAQDAAPLLEGAIKYDNGNKYAHLNLGDAYRLLGRPADAKRELDWVLGRDPSLAQAHYNLGLLYLFSENIPGINPKQATDQAISELEQYKKLKPRTQAGVPDDADELITRAKTKKAVLESKESEAAAAPPAGAGKSDGGTTPAPPPAGGGTKSGTSGSKAPTGGTGSGGTGGSGSKSTGAPPPAGGPSK